MHPYYHALSSQREHGGRVDDYLGLHRWFDSSKTGLAFFTHRSIHHHHEGILEAVKIFGESIVNADGAQVSAKILALQHCAEDMSIMPSAADWLQHMELPETGGPIRIPASILTTHQFESFPRVVAVGDKTGSFEQYISARG